MTSRYSPAATPKPKLDWSQLAIVPFGVNFTARSSSLGSDVPLIHLPLRCRCGSDQFGIIVGAVSAGKWQAAPGQPGMPAP